MAPRGYPASEGVQHRQFEAAEVAYRLRRELSRTAADKTSKVLGDRTSNSTTASHFGQHSVIRKSAIAGVETVIGTLTRGVIALVMGECACGLMLTLAFVVIPKCKANALHSMATGSTGEHAWGKTRPNRTTLQRC